MKLSELISELIDMKLDGEPPYDDLVACDVDHRRRDNYRDRLIELENEIDAIVENAKA